MLSAPPRPFFRRTVVAAVVAGLAFLAACRPKPDASAAATRIAVTFDPARPAVGENHLTVTLTDAAGNPVRLTGKLEIEGNMNHAGMRPSFARLAEAAPGRYTGTLEFTMGGDWFLLLSGDLPNHTRLDRKIEVPGVGTE